MGGGVDLSRSVPANGSGAADGKWKQAAVSVPGTAHLSQGAGNQDAICTTASGGVRVLALADGAGSAGRSAEGARIAVTLLSELLASRAAEGPDWETELRNGLYAVRKALTAAARDAGSRPRSFACTLLVAVLHDDGLNAMQLGDGAIVLRGEEGWRLACKPHRGRYAGETIFATSPRAARLNTFARFPSPSFDAVGLLSDGLESVALDLASDEPHGPFFDPLAAFVASDRPKEVLEEELRKLLTSERIRSRCSDDLSLIMAVRP